MSEFALIFFFFSFSFTLSFALFFFSLFSSILLTRTTNPLSSPPQTSQPPKKNVWVNRRCIRGGVSHRLRWGDRRLNPNVSASSSTSVAPCIDSSMMGGCRGALRLVRIPPPHWFIIIGVYIGTNKFFPFL